MTLYLCFLRLLCTGDFIFSSSYDKTVKAWLFDTSELDEGSEDKACIRTFKGHAKGVYPLIFIPAEESLVLQNEEGPVINPGDVLISGSDVSGFEKPSGLKKPSGRTSKYFCPSTNSVFQSPPPGHGPNSKGRPKPVGLL